MVTKNTSIQQTASVNQIKKSAYNFVEQYTLIQPGNIMANYRLWSACKTVPVAYESRTQTAFRDCVLIPTDKPFMEYLTQLEQADENKIKNPHTRTISVINFEMGKRLFILPDFQYPDNPKIIAKFNDGSEKSWPLYVTPEINRAIVEQLKIHTRQ